MKKYKIPKKFEREVLRPKLEEILRICTMKTAKFGYHDDDDKFIKDTIRIWVESWISGPIEEILESIAEEPKKQMSQTELFPVSLSSLNVGDKFSFFPHGQLHGTVIERGRIFADGELHGIRIESTMDYPFGGRLTFGESECDKIVYILR